VLFVASEPPPLRGIFKFETEDELVREGLRVAEPNWHRLDSPTAQQLGAKVKEVRPDVIHLSGFDTHFARTTLLSRNEVEAVAQLDNVLGEGQRLPGELSDGYVLAGSLHPVRPHELGAILATGGHRPHLVALNIGNSAARIAPLMSRTAPMRRPAFKTISMTILPSCSLLFSIRD